MGQVQGYRLRRKAHSKGETEETFCPDKPHKVVSWSFYNLTTNHIPRTVMSSSEAALGFLLFPKQWLSPYFKTSKNKSYTLHEISFPVRTTQHANSPGLQHWSNSTFKKTQQQQHSTKTRFHSIVQAGLQLMIFLPLPSGTNNSDMHFLPSTWFSVQPSVSLLHPSMMDPMMDLITPSF